MLNESIVAFSCTLDRLLRTPAQGVQQRPEIPNRVEHLEVLPEKITNTRQRPLVRRVAVMRPALGQQGEQVALLIGGEVGGAARSSPSAQGIRATCLKGAVRTLDGREVHPELACEGRVREVVLLEEPSCFQTAFFHLRASKVAGAPSHRGNVLVAALTT